MFFLTTAQHSVYSADNTASVIRVWEIDAAPQVAAHIYVVTHGVCPERDLTGQNDCMSKKKNTKMTLVLAGKHILDESLHFNN